MSNFCRKLFDRLTSVHATAGRALPQQCALCAAPAGDASICAACDASLPRLGPACPCCALPTPGGIVCGRCIARPPPFTRTHAAFAYAFPLDRLLQAMKYGGALAYADFFAGALGRGIVVWPDVLVALPLAPARQRQRGFNQAQEIVRRLARLGGVPAVTGIKRTRDTPAQASLPWKERTRNVRNAFAALPVVAGRRIAIVDDVMTTGATLIAAAIAARRAGALTVEVFVVARTLPPAQQLEK
jgi:ComF family protein